MKACLSRTKRLALSLSRAFGATTYASLHAVCLLRMSQSGQPSNGRFRLGWAVGSFRAGQRTSPGDDGKEHREAAMPVRVTARNSVPAPTKMIQVQPTHKQLETFKDEVVDVPETSAPSNDTVVRDSDASASKPKRTKRRSRLPASTIGEEDHMDAADTDTGFKKAVTRVWEDIGAVFDVLTK